VSRLWGLDDLRYVLENCFFNVISDTLYTHTPHAVLFWLGFFPDILANICDIF
jgi:hypothetical protein